MKKTVFIVVSMLAIVLCASCSSNDDAHREFVDWLIYSEGERSSRNMDEIVDLLGETDSAVDILSDDTIPIETRDRLYKERMEYINKRLKKMNDANRAQN